MRIIVRIERGLVYNIQQIGKKCKEKMGKLRMGWAVKMVDCAALSPPYDWRTGRRRIRSGFRNVPTVLLPFLPHAARKVCLAAKGISRKPNQSHQI